MSTPYNKPRGYFDRILGIDCETTGLCFGHDDVVYNENTGERHQTISWGMVIADVNTFNVVDELYVEIKWNDESIRQRNDNADFGRGAEKVHGLTQQYLEDNGVSEEEAVLMIGQFIIKHFGTDSALKLLGHNVHLFDLFFLRDLFKRYGIPLKFANRHIDSSSVSLSTIGAFNSDDMFATFGFDNREDHNALTDIKMTVETLRMIKLLWHDMVKINAYE